jgi:hypothetical protein
MRITGSTNTRKLRVWRVTGGGARQYSSLLAISRGSLLYPLDGSRRYAVPHPSRKESSWASFGFVLFFWEGHKQPSACHEDGRMLERVKELFVSAVDGRENWASSLCFIGDRTALKSAITELRASAVCAVGWLQECGNQGGAHVLQRGDQEALLILQIAVVNISTIRLTFKNYSLQQQTTVMFPIVLTVKRYYFLKENNRLVFEIILFRLTSGLVFSSCYTVARK